MRLSPYPRYKESKHPFLGQIPLHWPEKRGKYFFAEVDERSTTGDEEMLSVSHITGVTPRSQKNVTMFMSESNIGQKKCEPGDIVINTLWAWMSALGVSVHHGIVSPAYGVYRARDREAYEAYFLDHLLRIEPYRAEYVCRSTGVRSSRLRLYPDKFLSMPIICPPKDEQTVIAKFLKAQDRAVGKFIRNKRRLIELLKEQKQNLINQAVTRGLDPNVKLKPSGVEWIGDIPEHWECKRLKYLFREVDERSVSGDEQHLSMSQKHGGLVISSQIDERRLMSTSYAGGKLCNAQDMVLNRLKAHLGVFALAPTNGVVSPDYSVFRAIADIDTVYFEHLLRSQVIRPELRVRCKGIVEGFWRLYSDDFLSLAVPNPPKDGQQAIVKGIEARFLTIDQTITRAEREIELITEYRTRLVSDVVTGKLDVCGADVPETSDEELLALAEEAADNDELIDHRAKLEVEA